MGAAFDSLLQYMEGKPVVNTHCHHMKDGSFSPFSLETLLENSYVNWCGVPFGQSSESRNRYFSAVRYNSYFIWLQKSLQAIYRTSRPLNAENWGEFSEMISRSHQNREYHISLLRNLCHYENTILDATWEPGSDNGHPDVFFPTYRINMFLYGYNRSVRDHNQNNPILIYGENPETLDEYIAFMKGMILQKKREGCVALKAAIPYDRGLDFTEVGKEKARRAFGKDSSALSEDEIKHFQDYVFFEICRTAAELDLPLQCHAGLGRLRRSNAIYMREVIEKNPGTKFVLFHGNYPWTDDFCAIIHNYRNVYPDLCWLPLISTSGCVRALEELIEVGLSDRICWGCDTWTSEESYGALLAARFVLASVFAKKVEDGYFSLNDAETLTDNILFYNAKRLYFHTS